MAAENIAAEDLASLHGPRSTFLGFGRALEPSQLPAGHILEEVAVKSPALKSNALKSNGARARSRAGRRPPAGEHRLFGSTSLAVALFVVVTSAWPGAARPASGQEPEGPWRIDAARSIFALATRKGGWAEGRAHDHVVVAGQFQAALHWAGDPATADFDLQLLATDLEADPIDVRRSVAARLAELGLRDGELSEISEQQRGKIRETMLSDDQLDAEQFPNVAVELVEVREEASTLGLLAASHRCEIELEAHGRKARVPFQARLVESATDLEIEAVGSVRFTDLGVEPYSAFLGAVKNLDETTLYLKLVAHRSP